MIVDRLFLLSPPDSFDESKLPLLAVDCLFRFFLCLLYLLISPADSFNKPPDAQPKHRYTLPSSALRQERDAKQLLSAARVTDSTRRDRALLARLFVFDRDLLIQFAGGVVDVVSLEPFES